MSYQLVIAEKPSVARSIAGVIGAGKKQDGYMEGNMIDGMMNNTPSMEELEARAKAGEQISLLDVAEAAKAEAKKPKQTRRTTQKQKKPSIRAQLAAAKEEQKKKPPAREKSKEMEV